MKEAAYFAGKVLSIRTDCEIVDCQNFPYLSCFSAKLLASLKRRDLFITWHEVWGEYWYEYLGKKGILGEYIELAAARLTESNIAVSERTRRDLERLGVKGVQVVPNGIDWQRIEQIRPSEKQSDIICAGRLLGHKNVDLLIQALGTGVVGCSGCEGPDSRRRPGDAEAEISGSREWTGEECRVLRLSGEITMMSWRS